MPTPAPTPQEWNAARRDLLARLRQEIAPFATGGPIDYAAYRAATAKPLKTLARHIHEDVPYLAQSFLADRKAEICAFHHAWMHAHVAPSGLRTMLERRVVLWRKQVDRTVYSARIHTEQWVAREGELTIDLFLDDKLIFYVSFSIVPADRVGAPGSAALLISRLQGARSRFEEMRRAGKDLCDVAPRAVLFAVLTGVARACGLGAIAGVAAENFITYRPERHDDLIRQYDDFFRTLDGQGPCGGFFLIDLDAPPKPVSEVKAGHRIRTRRKRALRQEIATETAVRWERLFAMPPAAPSPRFSLAAIWPWQWRFG